MMRLCRRSIVVFLDPDDIQVGGVSVNLSELKTGLHSKKAFDLFASALNDEAVKRYAQSEKGMMKRLDLYPVIKTGASLGDAVFIDETGEVCIELLRFDDKVTLKDAQMFIYEALMSARKNAVLNNERWEMIDKLTKWIKHSMHEDIAKDVDFSDIIGSVMDPFEQSVMSSLVDEFLNCEKKLKHSSKASQTKIFKKMYGMLK